MTGFFRSIFNKISGSGTKNKHPVSHIEGAENVLVDSSVFCCPVCYNVFCSVPSILQCGHTFCGSCVRNISISENMSTQQGSEWVFLCPLCRESCSTKRIVRNYIVEDLLHKIDSVLPEGEIAKENEYIATLRLSKQRTENRCKELEQIKDRLTNEVQELKRRDTRNMWIVLFFAFSAYIISSLLFNK